MKKKYYNDAIIGNNNIVASFSDKGEMLRLFYPTRDCRQFVDTMYTGVKVNDSALIYLHEDINNQYEQYYTENTNILNTKIKNTYFNLSILQTDFVCIDKDVIIKKYKITNENTIELNVDFLIYSKLLSSFNNMVGTKIEKDTFMQYSHNYTYNIFSNKPILGYRLNNSKDDIKSGIIQDKDYVGMANDSAVSFNIGKINPGETKNFELYIYINNNRERYKFDEILEEVEKIKKIDIEKELEKTKKYWEQYVKKHDGLGLFKEEKKWEKILSNEKMKENLNEYTNKKLKETQKVYARTILLFPLLSNSTTGGISAALEVDEEKDKSGRYSYCWPRDAVFITKALDMLNMEEETTKFYTQFSKNTQSKNGMWEQRFYTDGKLAPCWGYQIDETASIVYGIYEHYKRIKDKEFLKETLSMCKKAIEFLKKYTDYIIDNKNSDNNEIFERNESYDLWEMYEGIHLYSLSAIYAAYSAMQNIEKELENKETVKKLEKSKNEDKNKYSELEKYKEKIKKYCLEKLCNKEEKTLKRNNKDNITDISILGIIEPFNMLNIEQKEIQNTIEKINLTLRTYTGGYIRFEDDTYIGGKNPWPIATLWMALYNMKSGKKEEALQEIEFVTQTATNLGLIAEQIDNGTLQSKWVIGLGWSHAMYVIALCRIGDVS